MLRLGAEIAAIDANGKPLKGTKTPLGLKVLLLGWVHCVLMYSASPQEPFPVPRGSARRAFTRHPETTHSAAQQGCQEQRTSVGHRDTWIKGGHGSNTSYILWKLLSPHHRHVTAQAGQTAWFPSYKNIHWWWMFHLLLDASLGYLAWVFMDEEHLWLQHTEP